MLDKVSIREKLLRFAPEITTKVSRQYCRIYEVGISFSGRSYEQGRKIGWKDGVRALYGTIKSNAYKK